MATDASAVADVRHLCARVSVRPGVLPDRLELVSHQHQDAIADTGY